MQFHIPRSSPAWLAVLATMGGCPSPILDASTGDSGWGGAVAGSSSAGSPSAADFPCDVQQLLAEKCWLCHAADPPGVLTKSADFRESSKSDPAQTVAEVALARLQVSTVQRMPPAPLEPATAAELALLSSWIQGGALAGSCDQRVTPSPDPYDTPLVCTSATQWTRGNEESPLMRPGGACIHCHTEEDEGPTLAVAGTLYATPHEPDDCYGAGNARGAQVVVTDADGQTHTLQVNGAGNFFLEAETFAFPYQAKVVFEGRERVMVEPQTSGDCNDCHTQDGRENAPGRIFLP